MKPLKKNRQLSPWSIPPDPELIFPREDLEQLLSYLGWEDPLAWLQHWIKRGGGQLASSAWPVDVRTDWLWGLGLPFLSHLEQYVEIENNRVLFGLSGLPGSGKTTFGKWLEVATTNLGWPVKVISMDDYYLPSSELDKAMYGNPWNVPRGLPGSHSIELLEDSIDTWLDTGDLHAPQFDKALREGRGDRCGWQDSQPKVLVLEGWFLGCSPTTQNSEALCIPNGSCGIVTTKEQEYQKVIQASLKQYIPIWERLERVWHLKASKFNSTRSWKMQQEMNMQSERGSSLQGKSLDLFLRMIETAIPPNDLESIDANCVAIINKLRQIIWVGIKEEEPSQRC